MRQYVYAIFWGALIGVLIYACLDLVKFKNNTVRFIVSVIFGVSVFTMVGLQVERFTTTPILLATDSGNTIAGAFTTHFPSPTKIIFDSRSITVNSSNVVTGYGVTSPVPAVGSIVTGPFISPDTTLVSITNTAMPSNPYVPGLLATISKPLVNIKEEKGNIFVYTFTPPVVAPVAKSSVAAPVAAPVIASVAAPVAAPVATFPASPVATGLGSSRLTLASGLAPISASASASASARATGPNMNEIYVTDPVTCGALNGKIVSSGLCGIQAS